jgi:hypothetical protein
MIIIFIVILAFASYWLVELRQHSNLTMNKATVATVASAQQEVRYRKGGDFQWKEAQKGVQLSLRDRVFTGDDSQAEIEVNQTKIKLTENSLIEIGPPKDYDVKLEFGFLVLNLKDRPLKIQIKNKSYLISPKQEMTLTIKSSDNKIEFLGDALKAEIEVVEGQQEIRPVIQHFFNSDLCDRNFLSAKLLKSELCPGCTSSSKLFVQKDGAEKILVVGMVLM